VYAVANPASPPAIPAGQVLVFRNGLFCVPNADYSQGKGTTLLFSAGVLAAGDKIAVVTIP
jgi:hypothetical protein